MFLILTLTCAGCGKSRATLETELDLSYIGRAYHGFHADRGRGPHNADELIAYDDPAAQSLPGNAATQRGVRKALQSGNYVVVWDVEIREQNEERILAYQRDVPEKGGPVCYQTGSVRTLTREEFEQAPKSKPKPAAPK